MSVDILPTPEASAAASERSAFGLSDFHFAQSSLRYHCLRWKPRCQAAFLMLRRLWWTSGTYFDFLLRRSLMAFLAFQHQRWGSPSGLLVPASSISYSDWGMLLAWALVMAKSCVSLAPQLGRCWFCAILWGWIVAWRSGRTGRFTDLCSFEKWVRNPYFHFL